MTPLVPNSIIKTPTPEERIIFAADVDGLDRLEALQNTVGEHVRTFKVGLELYTAYGPVAIQSCHQKKLDVFLDLKFKDIPTTVAGASKVATKHGVKMFNVHAMGGPKMMEAARKSIDDTYATIHDPFGPPPLLLAVTVLTSLGWDQLTMIGLIKDTVIGSQSEDNLEAYRQSAISDIVVRLAALAKVAGCDGVVCSPKEIKAVRKVCGPDFTIVTPGVRPEWAAADDQKRVMTPGEAVKAGADYLVIGRPISSPPPTVGTPEAAVKLIVGEIRQALEAA